MKKTPEVPLYTLTPYEVCLIKDKKFRVTATKQIKKEGSHFFQSIYLKEIEGKDFVFAPAGLMVAKAD